jgi:hypothetical protein
LGKALAPLVSEAILMGDRPFADIGNDLHVGVAVGREAGFRRDLVVIPHAEIAPAHAGRIAPIGEGEVVAGVQPVVAEPAKPAGGAALDHGDDLSARGSSDRAAATHFKRLGDPWRSRPAGGGRNAWL